MTRERELECVIADLKTECQSLRMQLADTEALEISHGERIIKQRETIAALKKQRDELLADMELILSAEERGFGIDYIKGCAKAAIASVKEQEK